MAVTGQFSKFIFVCMLLQSTTVSLNCRKIAFKLVVKYKSRGISIMQITCDYMPPVS